MPSFTLLLKILEWLGPIFLFFFLMLYEQVLTCRLGSAVMLSLVYSEMLKMLRICGFLDFDVEIYFPHDLFSLPRGYHKQKSKLSDQPHIMTAKSLLVEVSLSLVRAFF